MISANPGIGALSQEAGADDFIEKPFDVPYFLEMIEKHLNKKTRLSY